MDPLYERIKEFRKLRHMTQAELAKDAGYSDRSAIALIESGKIDLPKSKINAIADALRIPPELLLGVPIKSQFSGQNLTLMEAFEKLNQAGKEKVTEYATDLAENPKYTEDGEKKKDA